MSTNGEQPPMPYLPWNVVLSPDDVFLATSIAHTTCAPEMVDLYRRRAGALWSMQGVPEFLDQERLRGLARLHRRTCAMADAIEEISTGDNEYEEIVETNRCKWPGCGWKTSKKLCGFHERYSDNV